MISLNMGWCNVIRDHRARGAGLSGIESSESRFDNQPGERFGGGHGGGRGGNGGHAGVVGNGGNGGAPGGVGGRAIIGIPGTASALTPGVPDCRVLAAGAMARVR
jgi:hypothetical protein